MQAEMEMREIPSSDGIWERITALEQACARADSEQASRWAATKRALRDAVQARAVSRPGAGAEETVAGGSGQGWEWIPGLKAQVVELERGLLMLQQVHDGMVVHLVHGSAHAGGLIRGLRCRYLSAGHSRIWGEHDSFTQLPNN